MELFDYLMAKKGHNTGRDLFSYLLGKNAGGSGTYTTFSGISLNISNTVFGRIKNFMLNSTELTQDGTPAPDNPVEINVIKGDNNIKISNGTQEQNYSISLGGNKFEANKMSLGYYIDGLTGNLNPSGASNVSDYMEVIEGLEYTLNYSYVNLASFSSRAICYFDQNKNFIAPENPYTYNPKNTPIKITPPTNAKFVRFTLDKNITNVEFYPSNAIEYCKIGDYADQIFKNTTDSPFYDNTLVDGDWYVKKNIQKTIINKNTLADLSYNNTSYSVPALLVAKSNFGRSSSWGAGYTLTNTYKEITSTSGVANGVFASNFSQNYLWFFNNDFTSSQEALNLIDGTIVYIVRTTPTYIHITPTDYPTLHTQLDNLYNNAKSYKGQTNITQTNDDLPFNISVDVLIKNEE